MITLEQARTKAKKALESFYQEHKKIEKMRKNLEKYYGTLAWNSAFSRKEKYWKEATEANKIISHYLKRST